MPKLQAIGWLARSLITTLACIVTACTPPQPKGVALYDGKTLAGWQQQGEGQWLVKQGFITAAVDSGDTMLVTETTYQNYALSLEFWVDANTNSGVFIHCKPGQAVSPFNCYEINIWDDHPKQEYRTGAIVIHVAPPLAQVNSVGNWNRLEIITRGSAVSVKVNGVTTALLESGPHSSGLIALQRFNNGVVKFRDIRLQALNNE